MIPLIIGTELIAAAAGRGGSEVENVVGFSSGRASPSSFLAARRRDEGGRDGGKGGGMELPEGK